MPNSNFVVYLSKSFTDPERIIHLNRIFVCMYVCERDEENECKTSLKKTCRLPLLLCSSFFLAYTVNKRTMSSKRLMGCEIL
jgi:hypothetical protein